MGDMRVLLDSRVFAFQKKENFSRRSTVHLESRGQSKKRITLHDAQAARIFCGWLRMKRANAWEATEAVH